MRQKSQLEAAASVIDADIIGSTECRARGITVRGGSPALALCRALIGAGYDPSRPLHVYRGATLALIIHTIGEGAKLTVAEGGHRPRFRRLEPQDWAKVRGTSGQGGFKPTPWSRPTRRPWRSGRG